MFDSYQPLAGCFDELVAADGLPRPYTRRIHALLSSTPAREFARYQSLAELSLFNQGVTFSVYSDKRGTEKIFPICLVPRMIAAAEWRRVERGLAQRIAALCAFLDDIYGDQKIVRDGTLPADLILGAQCFLPSLRGMKPPGGVRIPIAGIDLIHVPYKNSSQGYADTISGEIQAFFFNLPGPLPHVKSGRLRALAVTSAKRAPQVPDLPTMMEAGVPGFEVTVWQGYAVTRATPKPYVDKIHAAMMKALAQPELQRKFFDAGVAAAPQQPAEFVKFIEVETAKWKKVVTVSGAKIEQ